MKHPADSFTRAMLTSRAAVVGCMVLLAGCSKKEPVPAEKSPQPTPAAQLSATPTVVERLRVPFLDLRYKAEDGVSAAPREAEPSPALPTDVAPAPQLVFSRLAAGDGFFCGPLQAGPLRCFGRYDRLWPGAFVDAAVVGAVVCAVEQAGTVSCFDATSGSAVPGPTEAAVTRISGAGSRLCVLDLASHMRCYAPSDPWAVLPSPQVLDDGVSFMAATNKLSCAALKERTLHCWGDADLVLPLDGPVVRDLGVGHDFVAALDATGQLLTFGKAPSLTGKYEAISAGYGTLCGSSASTTRCVGAVTTEWPSKARRVSVGPSAVCALFDDHAECRGENAPSFPVQTDRAPAAVPKLATGLVSSAQYADFLGLFPEVQLPLTLNRTVTLELGDRIPKALWDLIGADAVEYRTASHFTLPGGQQAVLVVHMKSGRLELRTFEANGTPRDRLTVGSAAFESHSIGDDNPHEYDFHSRVRSVDLIEATLEESGQITVVRTQGTEASKYARKHIDGTQPLSHIDCNLSQTTTISLIGADARIARKSSKVSPLKSSRDKEGCGSAWPS